MKKTILTVFASCVGISIVSYIALLFFIQGQGIDMTIHGYIAMGLGIFFTYAIGAALMTLLFFSNKHGHDDEVYSIHDTDDEK